MCRGNACEHASGTSLHGRPESSTCARELTAAPEAQTQANTCCVRPSNTHMTDGFKCLPVALVHSRLPEDKDEQEKRQAGGRSPYRPKRSNKQTGAWGLEQARELPVSQKDAVDDVDHVVYGLHMTKGSTYVNNSAPLA